MSIGSIQCAAHRCGSRAPLTVCCEVFNYSGLSSVAVPCCYISKGAQVDVRSNDGDTALIEAAKLGHVDVLQLLLDAGHYAHLTISIRI